ncbi:endonuclease [Ideonella sp. 4Y11]|uniref:Excinuclease cho n=1 Tax=Ideonella aquatica TaxID=2824119 RepID=A0A941BLU7_9BURK|nr:endonuclease [Ideonella aquatica]MBQ0960104.1 endonuclease [Ideonella aquatica]
MAEGPRAQADALRSQAEALPEAPGVYLFWGRSATLPLYIGKSIHLRSRVLSHLRDPDSARWVAQSLLIEHRRTPGEVGALLLEAALVKQLQPLHNQRLRRLRHLHAWRLVDGAERPELVDTTRVDFATTPHLHGLFASRHAAQQALRSLADEHHLCLQRLGLERPWRGSGACFRARIARCGGVCAGHEAPAEHDARLHAALAALRLLVWPHPGAVGLIECDETGWQQVHVLRHWCYLGSADTLTAARALDRSAPGFDMDSYRILSGGVLREGATLVPL